MFQSLAGFLGRCDLKYCMAMRPRRLEVSIPGGFSWSLRHCLIHRPKALNKLFQSLAGFLGRCDVSANCRVRLIAVPFQSLAGFLGRCDRSDYIDAAVDVLVSIPGGFSWSLRHWIGEDSPGEGPSFQSLAGFLGRCDAKIEQAIADGKMSFNPWRVFLVVATWAFFRGFNDL